MIVKFLEQISKINVVGNTSLINCPKCQSETSLMADFFSPLCILNQVTGSCSYHYDSSAFLFSLVNNPGCQPLKLDQTGAYIYNRYSIYSCNNSGPRFGGGHDIYIADNAASNTNSYSELGHTYSPPAGHSYGSSFTRSFLAGSHY